MSTGVNALPRFARELLASCPSTGGGVHNWLFRTARVLHPFFADKQELACVLENASANCGRNVPEPEIVDAVRNSAPCAWKPGERSQSSPAWPEYDQDLAKSILEEVSIREYPRTGQLFDRESLLWRSPVAWPDVACAATILRLLHGRSDPLICAGLSTDILGTGPLPEWERGVRMRVPGEPGCRELLLDDLQFVVPNAMPAEEGIAKHGGLSPRCRDNAAKQRRFLVVEFDQPGDEDLQHALLWHLGQLAPLVLCVHSGKKSFHRWFFVEPQTEDWQRRFFRYAVALGADPQMWWPEQLSRMPNGKRRDADGSVIAPQPVLYFDPHCLGNLDLPERFAFFDPAWLQPAEGAGHG